MPHFILFEKYTTAKSLAKNFCYAAVSCEFDQSKNNIRLFGFGDERNLSVKLSLPGIRQAGYLRREIKVRKLLTTQPKTSFGAPEICRYDLQSGRWITEPMVVQNKSWETRELVDEFIQDHALAFYHSTSRLHSLSSRRIYGMTINEIVQFLPGSGHSSDLSNLLKAKWPIGFCHGDLGKGNMMRGGDGKLLIIDWEAACVMPVAADLRRIYTRNPAVRGEVLSILARLSKGNPDAISPETQMAHVLAADSALRKKGQDKMTQYYMQARGMTAKRALRHFLFSMEWNRTLMQELQ